MMILASFPLLSPAAEDPPFPHSALPVKMALRHAMPVARC